MKRHPLFEAYPLEEEREISVGNVPTPYHIYDGQGMLIGGTADFDAVSELLQNETIFPLQTVSGKALMGVWVVDFSDASLGPHHELQLSFFVAHEPQPPVVGHPLAILEALLTMSQARMFCYGLWNNSDRVVAYNRELLGLDAKMTKSVIKQQAQVVSFHFEDENGRLLCEGQVTKEKRTLPKVGWALMRAIGLRRAIQAMRAPYLAAKVVNPIGHPFDKNRDAQSFLAADQPVVQFYKVDNDRMLLGMPYGDALNFQPEFIEHFSPFRFVYLMPS